MIDILAIDPGLARFGAVIVRTDGVAHQALDARVFTSDLRAGAFDIALADDRVRRARELSRWLNTMSPPGRVDIVAAEAMSFPRGAHAITAMCLAWGVVASFLEDRRLSMVSAFPSYWRTCLIGKAPVIKGLSKAKRKEMTEARERAAHAKAVQIVPSAIPLIRRFDNEHQLHALDSLGVFAWSLQTMRVRDRIRGVG